MSLRKTKLTALLLTGVVLASFAAGCGSEKKPQASANADVTADEAGSAEKETGLFQAMDAKDLEGNALDSSIFAENKLTVVNVWNVGCTPCIQEIPVLEQLNSEYEGNGVAIKGMYYNFGSEISEEDKAAIDEILTNAGAEYTQIVPSQAMYETEEMMDVQVFPTTYFVDSEGTILDKIEGSDDYDGWKNKIETALEKVQ